MGMSNAQSDDGLASLLAVQSSIEDSPVMVLNSDLIHTFDAG